MYAADVRAVNTIRVARPSSERVSRRCNIFISIFIYFHYAHASMYTYMWLLLRACVCVCEGPPSQQYARNEFVRTINFVFERRAFDWWLPAFWDRTQFRYKLASLMRAAVVYLVTPWVHVMLYTAVYILCKVMWTVCIRVLGPWFFPNHLSPLSQRFDYGWRGETMSFGWTRRLRPVPLKPQSRTNRK